MTTQRRSYAGAAVKTTTTTGINSSDTTIPISDISGWPTGSNGPFYVVIEPGQASEEKILVLSRSSLNLLVVTSPATGRGADSTAAASHPSGSTIYPVGTSIDFDDANAHIYDVARDDHAEYLTTVRHDIPGRHLFGAALPTPGAPSDIGTTSGAGSAAGPPRADHVHKLAALSINSSGLFVAGVIDANAIGPSAVGSSELANGSVIAGKIGTGVVTATELATGSVGTAEIIDANVTTAKIADANVTLAKLPSGTMLPFIGTSAPPSPATGQEWVNPTTGEVKYYYGATTGWQPSWNTAWGELGKTVVSTDQTGISAEADVTGLSITWTAIANRKYSVRMTVPVVQQVSSAGQGALYITTSGNSHVAGGGTTLTQAASLVWPAFAETHETGIAAGSVTHKVRASTNVGTLSILSSQIASTLSVCDMGPNGNPA